MKFRICWIRHVNTGQILGHELLALNEAAMIYVLDKDLETGRYKNQVKFLAA